MPAAAKVGQSTNATPIQYNSIKKCIMGISPCGKIEVGAGVCVLVDAYSCPFSAVTSDGWWSSQQPLLLTHHHSFVLSLLGGRRHMDMFLFSKLVSCPCAYLLHATTE